MTRNVDPWPASESERFHRGIACTVVVLAVLWPLGMLLSSRQWSERGVLAAVLVVILLGSAPLWSHLRRSPAGFPDHVTVQPLDQADAAEALVAAREARRRSGYRSQRPTSVAVQITSPPPAPDGSSTDGERAVHDRFATRWSAFSDGDDLPDAGWSRRRTP